MAVLVELVVHATRQEYEAFDALVGAHIQTLEAPPAGLMVHLIYPADGGFVIADVYRDEESWRAFADEAIYPPLADLGLATDEVVVRPVWDLARP